MAAAVRHRQEDRQDWNTYRVFVYRRRAVRNGAIDEQTFAHDDYGNQSDVYEYNSMGDGSWTRHTKRLFYPVNDGTHYFCL